MYTLQPGLIWLQAKDCRTREPPKSFNILLVSVLTPVAADNVITALILSGKLLVKFFEAELVSTGLQLNVDRCNSGFVNMLITKYKRI